jgi:thioredoxin-related protein
MKHLLTFILIATVYTVQAQGIKFDENLSWAQIRAKAKSENKYIFMDVFATWCGPCKEMSDKVFPKEEVGNFINPNFIAVKVQMDQTKEDKDEVKSWYADAKAIGKQYQVTAYPTVLFFAPSGELVGRALGYKEANDLIAEAKAAMANSAESGKLFAQYNIGKRDSALVKGLARLSLKMGQTEKAQKVAQQYINSLSEQNLFKKENLQFVNQFTTSSKDKGFELFRKHGSKVNAVLGNNAAETKVRGIIGKEEIEPFIKDKANAPDWMRLEATIKSKYGALGLESLYGERMVYASDRKDWANFGKYYGLYYTTAYSRSRFHINNISWPVVEHVSDPAVLETAVKTMKYDIEHFDQNNLQAYDTYANLLYKAGKKDEAMEWESKAMKIEEENASKQKRKPDPVFAETLEKMKKGIKTWVVEEPKKQ